MWARGGGGVVTRVMCDSHAGLGAGHVTPRYTLQPEQRRPLFTLYTADEPHMETTLSGVLYNVLLIFWSTDISRYHCRL